MPAAYRIAPLFHAWAPASMVEAYVVLRSLLQLAKEKVDLENRLEAEQVRSSAARGGGGHRCTASSALPAGPTQACASAVQQCRNMAAMCMTGDGSVTLALFRFPTHLPLQEYVVNKLRKAIEQLSVVGWLGQAYARMDGMRSGTPETLPRL